MTKRFDGASEDAAREVWKWRPWTLLNGRGTASEARHGARFCLLCGSTEAALEGTRIEDLINVSHGIDLILRCLDERFPDLQQIDKMGRSWMMCCDCVVQQRMDCSVHRRCREVFEQAARDGVELPSVGRGYLMLRGASLGLTRKAIVPAVAGRSHVGSTFAQTLGATFPRHVAATRSVAQVVVDPDATLKSDEAPVDWRCT